MIPAEYILAIDMVRHVVLLLDNHALSENDVVFLRLSNGQRSSDHCRT